MGSIDDMNKNPQQEFKDQFALPDFKSFFDRYGWPKSDHSGYQIAEQLCGTERESLIVLPSGVGY